MPLSLFSNPIGWIQQLLKGKKRFHRAYQRPHSFFIPHLKGLPFHHADTVSQLLVDHWEEIREEFYAVEHLEISTPSTRLIDTGTWNTFPLMRSAKEIPENTARCPKTWAVVNGCPLLNGIRGGAYFSIIYPGTHIDSHCGPSNLKLRYHLTIEEANDIQIRSAQTWNTWK
ncbi:MAG: aspartyl/asparaginyl beta-hydroxylase domain-containing protein, partial [Cyanobacteria bacterium P01_E01_bin.34]